VQKGKDYRNIASEEALLTITLEEALHIFSQPKVYRRGGGANLAAKGPLREFGNDPVSGKPVVAKDGKFGVYVTDGETNASLSRGDRLEAMEPERAYELLAIRREAIIEKGGVAGRKAAATKKAAAKKGAAAKKTPAKKTPAKKTPAKKRTAKKPAPAKKTAPGNQP
jgi:DNA topoisomerase-1